MVHFYVLLSPCGEMPFSSPPQFFIGEGPGVGTTQLKFRIG